MAARVISFRVDDEMINELEKQKLPDESIMLTAQRVLREALGLGVIGEQARRVEQIVDSAVLQVEQRTEELRARLDISEEILDKLGDAYDENVPNLITDMWLVKQAIFECADPLIERVKQLEISVSDLISGAMLPDSLTEYKNKVLWLEENRRRDCEKLAGIESTIAGLMAHSGKGEATSDHSPDVVNEDSQDVQRLKCPHCGAVGTKFNKDGTLNGKQRYRCLSCGKKSVNVQSM